MKQSVSKHKRKYLAYIQSEEWATIKNDLIMLYGCCVQCGSKRKLEVHHLSYENIFNEEPEDLVLLCKRCHLYQHPEVLSLIRRKSRQDSKKVKKCGITKARSLIGQLSGYDLKHASWIDLAHVINAQYKIAPKKRGKAASRKHVQKLIGRMSKRR